MGGRRRSLLAFYLVCCLLVAVMVGIGVMGSLRSPANAGPENGGVAQRAPAGHPNGTPIDGCETIEKSGRYVLTRNVTNDLSTRTSQNCVWINASDVIFDGDGHRIDGIGVSDSTGVYVGSPRSQENVTVRNVAVSDWHNGVWYRGVSGGTVERVNASENAFGIAIENASAVAARNNSVSANLIGIRIADSTLSFLAGTDASGNYGIGIDDELTAFDAFGTRITVGPPLDLDGDGRYEDVTGDRHRTIADAVALFEVVTGDRLGASDLHADQRRTLDIDRDGRLDYGDVWALLGD